jgi:AraC family ethanolamine operon transcriptional activator
MAMETQSSSVVLINKRFDSFEELAELVVAWDLDFRQMNAEHFKSDIFQAQLGSMLMSRAKYGCKTDQYGATPHGMRTFVIPDIDCPEFSWFGHQIGRDVLLAFPTHGEIKAFTQTGFSVFTFSISEQELVDYFQQYGGVDYRMALDASEMIIPVDALSLDRIRMKLRRFETLISTNGNSPILNDLGSHVQEQLLLFVFDHVCKFDSVPTLPKSARNKAFARALDYMHANHQQRVSSAELCAYAQVSVRTLQMHFKREFGMTPKTYMNGQRLYGVHRGLWNSDPARTRVVDLANHWGFWHMGQFASDYRKLFGELPSETLKRAV